MKALLVMLVTLSCAAVGAVPLVNDRTTSPSAEDSLTVTFWAADSLGNFLSVDSVLAVVTDPGGAVTFADTLTVSDQRIGAIALGGASLYTLAEQVSHLTAEGPPGLYNLVLLARASSSPYCWTAHRVPFQVVAVSVSQQLAQIDDTVFVRGGVIDSNRTECGVPEAGDGAYSRTLQVIDTAAGAVVPGVGITLRNFNQTTVLARGWSNLDGRFTVNLNAGSLLVVAASPGYVFAAYDTIEVDGDGVDTLAAAAWNPGSAALPTLCRVWGHVYGINGVPEIGAAVTVALVGGPVRLSGIVVSPFEVDTTTDASGYFQFDLVPTSLLEPSDSEYEITIRRSDGAILRQRFTVPAVASWRLTW